MYNLSLKASIDRITKQIAEFFELSTEVDCGESLILLPGGENSGNIRTITFERGLGLSQ